MSEAVKASTSTGIAPSLVDKKAELERYYIQLLEKRIAELEELTKHGETEEPEIDDVKTSVSDALSSVDADGIKKEEETERDTLKAKRKRRIRTVVSKWDHATGLRKDEVVDEIPSGDKGKENLAFTFRRVLPTTSPKGNDGYSEVDIESKELRELLKTTIGTYIGQSWEGNIVNIVSPFMPLVHFWDKLQEATIPKPDDDKLVAEARSDLVMLLEHVQGDSELDKYFKTRESHLAGDLTSYETMWTLFVPGQRIYSKPFLGKPQLFVVHSPPYAYSRDLPLPPSLYVDCWCYDWNGSKTVKVWYYITIEQFRGTKAISDLVAYPLKFYKDIKKDSKMKNVEELVDHLVKRGGCFDETVRGPKGAKQQRQYDGEALSDKRSAIKQIREDYETTRERGYTASERQRAKEESKSRPVKIKGKYIVDHNAFLTYGYGGHKLADLEPNDVKEIEISEIKDNFKERKTGESFLSLLPPRFLGYSTQEKFWGQFSVDFTHPVSNKKTGDKFKDELQLGVEYKQMIHALVSSHQSQNVTRDSNSPAEIKDVVENKGKGLVILLHGPPGVGKTLTAETIAEASEKPLFIVSVAEIGLDAAKAEKNLEQMFTLAGSWEAVLLVDEADVFLETRTRDGDPNRNALVSVLLRVLEYYQGIMILTTNRITGLDVAVQSRIHLAIRYEDLSKEYKKKIFKIFLDQLEPESIKDRGLINDWVDEYGCDAKLNGRQIRNVVSSALALARSTDDKKLGEDEKKVTLKHLKSVVKITKDFQEQLESVTTASRMINEVKGSGN